MGFSLVAARGGYSLLHRGGFSCEAQALGAWPLVAAAHRLGSGGLSCTSMWDLPRPGIEPMSPALAGEFLYPLHHQGNSFNTVYIEILVDLQ